MTSLPYENLSELVVVGNLATADKWLHYFRGKPGIL